MNGQENEIMDLARRSGLGMLLEIGGMDKCLEHFAKLVAAKERESLRESFRVVTAAETSAAILHEREACAKVCDARDDDYGTFTAGECALAIRARGEA